MQGSRLTTPDPNSRLFTKPTGTFTSYLAYLALLATSLFLKPSLGAWACTLPPTSTHLCSHPVSLEGPPHHGREAPLLQLPSLGSKLSSKAPILLPMGNGPEHLLDPQSVGDRTTPGFPSQAV